MVENEGVEPSPSERLFIHLISLFHVAAMQHLGKLLDPVEHEVKRDMEQAKFAIDTLDMLKEKTRGNLSRVEEEFLSKVVFELHMNYVQELETETKEKQSKAREKSDSEKPRDRNQEGRSRADEAPKKKPPKKRPSARKKEPKRDSDF